MKTLLFLLLSAPSLWAQVGSYIYADKQIEEQLQILENETFIYSKKGQWANQQCKGQWKKEGEQLILNSEYRLSNFQVQESLLDSPGIFVEIRAKTKATGPRKIGRISLNQGSVVLDYDTDFAMQVMEDQQKALQKLQQDPELANRFLPVRYYSTEKKAPIQQFELEINGKKTAYPIENPAANYFIFTFELSPDDSYPYFEGEIFQWQGKNLSQGDKKWKKKK
jgi:hypothetical protein